MYPKEPRFDEKGEALVGKVLTRYATHKKSGRYHPDVEAFLRWLIAERLVTTDRARPDLTPAEAAEAVAKYRAGMVAPNE